MKSQLRIQAIVSDMPTPDESGPLDRIALFNEDGTPWTGFTFEGDIPVIPGAKGDKGDPGAPGPAGPEGPQGPKGDDGQDGEPGEAGANGLPGEKGDPGPKGDPGAPGADGVAGINGADGAPGPRGLDGADGADGPAGDPGPAGPRGFVGETGLTGAAGPKGDNGDVGPAGADGAPGPKGDTGDIGPTGPTGQQGLTGETGAQGLQGIPGVDGAPGAKGDKGDTGSTGPAGADSTVPGPQGQQGVVGPQGAKGDKGDTGQQGLQGIQGVKGDTGAQGIQGVKGDTGANGSNGTNGLSMLTGTAAPTAAVPDGTTYLQRASSLLRNYIASVTSSQWGTTLTAASGGGDYAVAGDVGGAPSAKLQPTGGTPASIQANPANYKAVTVGEVLTLTATFRNDTGRKFQTNLIFLDASDAVVDTRPGPIVTAVAGKFISITQEEYVSAGVKVQWQLVELDPVDFNDLFWFDATDLIKNDTLWTRQGGAWVSSGSIDGSPGAQGPKGDTGPAAQASSIPIEAWKTPAFTNGWTNYAAPFSVAYRKRPDGMVEIKGIATPAANGQAQAVFTLPAGYRPESTIILESSNANGACELRIDSGGVVFFQQGLISGVAWASVACHFSSAQTTFPTAGGTDVQVFTASGTWTKPAGAKKVRVFEIGGGSGGGAGRKSAAGTAAYGGGGGAGAGVIEMELQASFLNATEPVTVGLGGPGGAATSAASTNGASGSFGNLSRFGAAADHQGTGTVAPGGGGTTTSGNAASASSSKNTSGGGSGGSGSSTSGGGTGATGTGGGAGGGGGGGVTTASAAVQGGSGVNTMFGANDIASTNVVTNGKAQNGLSARGLPAGGGAGGSGSVTAGVNAVSGGDGGFPGGGGGGGGGALDTAGSSGAGGKGGDGMVIVTTYF